MTDKEKRKSIPFYKNPGFYLTLLIVFVFAASAALYLSRTKKLRTANPGVSMEMPSPEWTQPPALHTPTKTPVPTFEPTPEPTAKVTSTKVKYSLPSFGEITAPFDNKNLVYSEYFGDWRTHAATDFDGRTAKDVFAAADGVVEKIYTDDRYGLTLVLSHPDGCKTYYSSLAATADIKEGASVSRGDVIATAGTSCEFEKAQGEHLHFWAEKDGKAVELF